MILFDLRPYRHAFAVLAVALLLAAVTDPVADLLNQILDQESATLNATKERLGGQIRRWEQDAAAAEELSQTIDAQEMAVYLTPADRTRVAAQLEPLAGQARLAHMTFTISPPTPWHGDPDFPAITGIVQSTLLIEADAPHDAAVWRFLESLNDVPGRMDITQLAITRIAKNTDASLSAQNVHMKAQLLWLANQAEDNIP